MYKHKYIHVVCMQDSLEVLGGDLHPIPLLRCSPAYPALGNGGGGGGGGGRIGNEGSEHTTQWIGPGGGTQTLGSIEGGEMIVRGQEVAPLCRLRTLLNLRVRERRERDGEGEKLAKKLCRKM